MSVYTINIGTASCSELLAVIDELALNWTKEKQLAHDHNEGARYHEIREAIRTKCGADYEIQDVNNSGTYSRVKIA